MPGPERVLTRSGELVKRKVAMAPEPKDKLDAALGAANGPGGDLLDWDAVDWRACEESVRRLRQRIFTASRAGDFKRVCNLQRLMLRSRTNTLLSVRRVTERNAGRRTAGHRRRGSADTQGQDRPGQTGRRCCRVVVCSPGQAGVYSEGQKWEAAPARYPGACRSRAASASRQCARARVGGTI
jgi:hypothetical protein